MLRHRKDAEGDFLRKALGESFFPTAAVYLEVITASGLRLGTGWRPQRAWAAFQRLPEAERAPGAVKVGPLDPVDRAVGPPEPPPGALVLKAYGRLLTRNEGRLRHAKREDFALMLHRKTTSRDVAHLFEAHPDFVWITEPEWRSLVPRNPRRGDRFRISSTIVNRIARFHLVPRRLYGEGDAWYGRRLRHAELHAIVEQASPDLVRIRVEGSARLGAQFDARTATIPNGKLGLGYEAMLAGFIEYDRKKNAITRFDLIALGDVWGRMGDANGDSVSLERAGSNPLAFVFEKADATVPVNRIVPMGRSTQIRDVRYFDTDR